MYRLMEAGWLQRPEVRDFCIEMDKEEGLNGIAE